MELVVEDVDGMRRSPWWGKPISFWFGYLVNILFCYLVECCRNTWRQLRQGQLYGWKVLREAQYLAPGNHEVKMCSSWKVVVWENNLKVKKINFIKKTMIKEFGKVQYNAFMSKMESDVQGRWPGSCHKNEDWRWFHDTPKISRLDARDAKERGSM